MSAAFVQRAMEHVWSEMDVSAHRVGDPQRLDEFAREHGADRRFRIHLLAATSPLHNAIVRYRGVRYYVFRVPEPIQPGKHVGYRFEVEIAA